MSMDASQQILDKKMEAFGAYSRKYGNACDFLEKGQERAKKYEKRGKYLKIWANCTKFEKDC